MDKTYLLSINNLNIVYVFDKHGEVSYLPASEDGLSEFFTKILTLRSQQLNILGAKMDYSVVGSQAIKLLYSIAIVQGSDNILEYLKKFRDEGKVIGLTLKVKDGISDTLYNDNRRVTEDKARKELEQLNKYC